LEVELSAGVTLTARILDRETKKLLELEVREGDKRLAIWDYRPGESRIPDREAFVLELNEHGERVIRPRATPTRKKDLEGVPRGEQPYLEALKRHVPTLFILNADRRLGARGSSQISSQNM
jgi:hypothetical protein